MEIISTALLLILFSYLLYISTRRPKNFPPGLRRLPIIGQTFKGSRPLMSLWRKHKIIGHFIGNTPAVTIQDFQLARELLSREEWCGRGQSVIERYLRSDSGVCKVNQAERVEDQNLSLSGDYHLRRTEVAGTQALHYQTSQGVWLRQDWTGKCHSGGGGGARQIFLSQDRPGYQTDHSVRCSRHQCSLDNCGWLQIPPGRPPGDEDDESAEQVLVLKLGLRPELYCLSPRLFKEKFVVEYMFPVWGLICYLVPGLDTRRRIISELRARFRETISQHRNTIDINAPR